MSTFFMAPGHLGLPLASLPLHQCFPHHRPPHDGGTPNSRVDSVKPDGPGNSNLKAADDMLIHAGNGRCRSPISQPLRHRQLPASFWQEPNVPRGHRAYLHLPHPFHSPHWSPLPPLSSSASPSTPSVGHSNVSSECHGDRGKQGVQVHKEFLERLQSAQIRGYDLAASRFPITEFLFYNYGLRSYLESAASSSSSSSGSTSTSSSSSSSSLSVISSSVDSTAAGILRGHPPHKHHHQDQHPRHHQSLVGSSAAASSLTMSFEGSPEKMAISKATSRSSSGQALRGPNGVCGNNSPLGLTFPTLCPYLGYNCPNVHGMHPHRFWDCVLGQAAAAAASSSSSSLSLDVDSASGGVGPAWKDGRGRGRTISAFPARYHPFANA